MTNAAVDAPSARPDADVPPAARTVRLAVALLLCAISVRPLAVSLGPVLPGIQADVGLSSLLAGVVGMLPVVCLGLFAPLGVALANRVRPEAALAVALALTVGFGAGRALAPDAAWLVALTVGLGVGMGMAGPVPAMIIKGRAPGRPVMLTSAHGLGIVGGAVTGAVLIVPLAVAAGGWRGATLLVSVPIAVATVAGLVLLGRGRRPPPNGSRAGIGWRDSTAWLLAGIFGLQSLVYWGLVIWLAAILVEAGWTSTAAGSAVALYQVASFAGVVTVGLVADRIGTRRGQLVASSAGVVVALVGMLIAPALAVFWTLLAGYVLGAALPLALTLPVDLGRDERDTGAKAGLMLLVGYLLAALGPAVIGLVREWTLDRAPVFGALALCGLVFVALSLRLPGTPARARRSAAEPAA